MEIRIRPHGAQKSVKKVVLDSRGRIDWQMVALRTVQTGLLLSVAILAPNALGAMAKLGILPSPQRRQLLHNAQLALVRKGYLRCQDGRLNLTPLGEAWLHKKEVCLALKQKPKHWDKKWRMILFDIPEHRRTTRAFLRGALLRAGFCRMQQSAWIYPYEAEEFITLLKVESKLGKSVQYVLVDGGAWDRQYRKIFSLPT